MPAPEIRVSGAGNGLLFEEIIILNTIEYEPCIPPSSRYPSDRYADGDIWRSEPSLLTGE
jgi:hypothetical protein